MRVRQRGAALAALVDQQVDEGGVGVGAHAGAPGHGGGLDLLRASRSASEVTGIGRVDDHLLRAGGGLGGEEVGVGVRRRALGLRR